MATVKNSNTHRVVSMYLTPAGMKMKRVTSTKVGTTLLPLF